MYDELCKTNKKKKLEKKTQTQQLTQDSAIFAIKRQIKQKGLELYFAAKNARKQTLGRIGEVMTYRKRKNVKLVTQ